MFGIADIAVNPPDAAALEAVNTVSASSLPGSRKWVWRSTKPGNIVKPFASISLAPLASSPSLTNLPSEMK